MFDPSKLEHIACYFCSSESNQLWAEENSFFVCKCEKCGLLYVNPRPRLADISDAAKTGLHEGAELQNAIGSYWPYTKPGFKRRVRDMFSDRDFRSAPFSWLDVGCGYGEFMEAVHELSAGNARMRGCEPSAPKLRSARERGLDVSFFRLVDHPERYDYVSMLNVYSHLPDPAQTLAEMRDLLKPKGELLLQTGDVTDLERGDFPYNLGLPGHLSFAPEAVLRGILERVGFSVISVRKYFYNTIERRLASIIVGDIWRYVRGQGTLDRLLKLPQARRDMWVRARKE